MQPKHRGLVAALIFAFASIVPIGGGRAEAVSGRCPEWHDLAVSIGWTDAAYSRMSPIMFRESRCQPTAINKRSGDYGLFQVHMKLWGPILGLAYDDNPVNGVLDPRVNVWAAAQILRRQGYGAWSMKGGRVVMDVPTDIGGIALVAIVFVRDDVAVRRFVLLF